MLHKTAARNPLKRATGEAGKLPRGGCHPQKVKVREVKSEGGENDKKTTSLKFSRRKVKCETSDHGKSGDQHNGGGRQKRGTDKGGNQRPGTQPSVKQEIELCKNKKVKSIQHTGRQKNENKQKKAKAPRTLERNKLYDNNGSESSITFHQ